MFRFMGSHTYFFSTGLFKAYYNYNSFYLFVSLWFSFTEFASLTLLFFLVYPFGFHTLILSCSWKYSLT